MDIQISSNFERYLFYKLGGDTEQVKEFMASFAATGSAELPEKTQPIDAVIKAGSASNAGNLGDN